MMIFLTIAILIQVACAFAMWRNMRVYTFQGELLGRVSDAGHLDIIGGREWKWRFDELNKVSYNQMMLEFWKPLYPEAWWDDVTFLDPPFLEADLNGAA